MRIARLDRHPEFVETAVDWFVNEWGSTRQSAKDSLMDNEGCPPALVAMNSDGPMGILGYNIHLLLNSGDSRELWINALYVAPQWRHRGVGARLVRKAVKQAARANRKSLFVYTDIPTFYESLGWRRLSCVEETEMHILEYAIRPEAPTPTLIEDT